MTDSILSIDTFHDKLLSGRTKPINNKFAKSLRINQIDGNFIVSLPIENIVQIYNQNPNNVNGKIFSEISEISDNDTLETPMDSVFDWVRGKIWICDTGNNRLVKINYSDSSLDYVVSLSYFPYGIEVDENTGNIFVKSFNSLTQGQISILDKNGNLLNSVKYPATFFNTTFDIELSRTHLLTWDWQHSMKWDHVRNRLWWLANDVLYMMDYSSLEIVTNDLSYYGIDSPKSIGVNLENGNVVVGCRPLKLTNEEYLNYAYLAYFYKDNNYLIEIKKVYNSGI